MQSEVGCTNSSLKQPVRHAPSIAVMVILPIIRLTTLLKGVFGGWSYSLAILKGEFQVVIKLLNRYS